MAPSGNPPTDLEGTFSVLADESRLAILQALWNADERTVGFADLRTAVGMRDSGNFSYHLDRLVPQFVRRVDEEYALTYAGARVVGAAVSGTYSPAEAEESDPVPVGDCLDCGGTTEARHDGEKLVVECVDCGQVNDRVPAPPILASAFTPEEHPQVFSRYALLQVQKRSRGLCLLCDGPVDQEVSVAPEQESQPPNDRVTILHTCRACGLESTAGIGSVLVDHPAVLSFLYDAGMDVRETPIFELPIPEATVTSEDPVRVTARVEADGDVLELELDENLDVVDHERR